MVRFSVKRPFTVLVAAIIITILGYVSVTSMSTDLLPPISLPYMIVITPYPGASAERVELLVTEPLERALGTVSNVKNVSSVSSDNYCMIQLEFEDGIDMDATTVKVSGAATQAKATLPEEVGTPSILELSMDMIATMYLAVSRDGYDIYELSAFVDQTARPYLERVEGVANVSAIGLVEKNVQIDLNEKKIASVNRRIRKDTLKSLDEAGEQLEDALQKVEGGQRSLEAQQRSFGSTVSRGIFEQADEPVEQTRARMIDEIEEMIWRLDLLEIAVDDATSEETRQAARARLVAALTTLRAAGSGDYAAMMEVATNVRLAIEQIRALTNRLEEQAEAAPTLQEQIQATRDNLNRLETRVNEIPEAIANVETAVGALTQGQLDAAVGFSQAMSQMTQLQQTLSNAQAQYESAREQALKSANVDALINAQNLAQIIYAQNFAMPAGYIDDENDASWLLKVGEEYKNAEEIADAVLLDAEGFGTIRISDVADVTVVDNAGLSYTNLNGQDGVALSVYKSSAYGTNDVSANCKRALREFETDNEGTHIVILMDQGSYIDIIVRDLLQSMGLGALLAVIVLALFLRDVRPTVMVAISIPLSVLTTLVLMYFSDLSLNMMTLSGLSLGIGMLVDNSIVVMENIIRLRQRGVSPGNAAVQGTKQVAGAIIASTLTTVSVFVPMVFTTGTVRSLLVPMALSITYCLTASLIVAMTVVPASTTFILRKTREKKKTLFDRLMDGYERTLLWCLKYKAIALSAAVGALVFCVVVLLRMGIVMIPDIASEELEVTIRTPDGLTREESYAVADGIMDEILTVKGVKDVGIMDSASTTGLLSASINTGGSSSYGRYLCYVTTEDHLSAAQIKRVADDIEIVTSYANASVDVENSGMGDISGYASTGLSVNVYGVEMNEMRRIAGAVADEVRKIEGFSNVQDGTADDERALQLVVDRDKAMSYGLTVAQIYAQIASRMSTEANSTTIEADGLTLSVRVRNEIEPLTRENLLDMEFTATSFTDAAAQYGMGGASTSSSGAGALSEIGDMMSALGEDDETEEEDDEEETDVHKLGEFASLKEVSTPGAISRQNQTRYLTVTANTMEGYNTTLLSRELQDVVDEINGELPNAYRVEIEGETLQVQEMITQMSRMLALAFAFIYLVMVAQFQSFLSPFIIIFTIPLAFTGGMLGLLLFGEQLSLLSLMGFLVLMGTVVNNGIVFVDYCNQLRIGGLNRTDALVATGRTRMRPILMTAMTTILAMSQMIFGTGMGAQMSRGMAIVIAGGLIYATLMTLYIIPVMYDMLYKKNPLNVIVDEDLDAIPDDAAEYLAEKYGGSGGLEYLDDFDRSGKGGNRT